MENKGPKSLSRKMREMSAFSPTGIKPTKVQKWGGEGGGRGEAGENRNKVMTQKD